MKDQLDLFQNLEEGDRILYSDRSQPLDVLEVKEDSIEVKGPSGGEYIIFRAEDSDKLLVARKGNRRYASYVENLRKVGEWQHLDENLWKHSKTGAELRLEKKETGYWSIKSEDFDLEEEIDLPLYGYSDREFAEEDIRKLIKDNPEG